MTAQRILWLLNVCLLAGVAWLWLDETGQPRPHTWAAPEPLAPGLAKPESPPAGTAPPPNPAQFMAVLDRPLFAPDRRPPPPPDAMPPPPPPDPLASVTLYGLYGSGERGGILVKSEGRMSRIQLGQHLGEWLVKSMSGREVTFARGDEVRVLALVSLRGSRQKEDQTPLSVAPGKPPGMPLNLQAVQEQAMVEARERQRQNNELRRLAGLPPMKE